MKVILTKKTVTVYKVSHTDFLIALSTHAKVLTETQFIEYIRTYAPPFIMDIPDVEVSNWLSRLLFMKYFMSFSQESLTRILDAIFEVYKIDANYVTNFGSPLVLYAIQSGYTQVLDYLIKKGARLTENGQGVYNKKCTSERVDIPYCLKQQRKAVKEHTYKCLYNEICGRK